MARRSDHSERVGYPIGMLVCSPRWTPGPSARRTGRRLYGVVTAFRRIVVDSTIYGPGTDLAEIGIALDQA